MIILFLALLLLVYTIFPQTIKLLFPCRKSKVTDTPVDHFINNYKNVKKTTPSKVVVSFTTTPDKIERITPMLSSLLDQTARVDQISLNNPEKYKNKEYTVPEYLKNICNIYKAGKDYGIGTKYVPTLLREQENGTKIILVNDDIIYGKDFIETLVRESDANPDKCIFVGDYFNGSSGILLKPEFLNKITHETCDDKWLENNISVHKIKIPYKNNIKFLD